jgi:hypothetical protein
MRTPELDPDLPHAAPWRRQRGRHLVGAVTGGVLMAALSAPFAFAQSPPATWNGLPDRFQIDTGYFGLTTDTVLRYNGPQGGSGEVNLEEDLGLADRVDTFWVEQVRAAR